MRNMSWSLVLLLLGPSAYAQFAADSPYCRNNAAAPGCPPPVRVQVVPPPAPGYLPGTSEGMSNILRTLDSGMQNRREQRKLDLEERRLRLEEQKLQQSQQPPAPQPSATPAQLSPEMTAQVLAFLDAHPDWRTYAPGMAQYVGKLRPGDQTNATEFLTLIYRLAKLDAVEGAAPEGPKP